MNAIRLLPFNPDFVPDESDARNAVELIRKDLPGVSYVDVDLHDYRVFVQPAEGIDAVSCNACGSLIPMDWWSGAMNAMNEGVGPPWNVDLRVRTPCCSASTDLNALHYEPQAGFARFTIGIGASEMPSVAVVAEVEHAIGCKLRLIPSKENER